MNSKSLKASRNGEYGTSTNVKTLGTARCSGKGNAPAGIPGEEQEGQDRSPCRVFRLRDAAGTAFPQRRLNGARCALFYWALPTSGLSAIDHLWRPFFARGRGHRCPRRTCSPPHLLTARPRASTDPAHACAAPRPAPRSHGGLGVLSECTVS